MRGAKSNTDILYQVNGVAYIEADLKMADLRILMAIIKALQAPIKFKISRGSRSGSIPPGVMPEKRIFSPYRATRVLHIPVEDFNLGTRNGHRLRSYLYDLTTTRCVFPLLPPREGKHQPMNVYSGLIVDFDFPLYSQTVDIMLQEEMVSRLLLTENGYSHYSHSSALSMTNKCTVRIYWLICSWRNRGGFAISLDNLLKILSLGKGYHRRNNLVEKIIKPAQKDLEDNFPIWFRYRLVDSKDASKIIFKIQLDLTPEQREVEKQKVWNIYVHSLIQLGVKPDTLNFIYGLLDAEDVKPFSAKIQYILLYVKENMAAIRDADAYVREAMQQWFNDWNLRYQDVAETDDYPSE